MLGGIVFIIWLIQWKKIRLINPFLINEKMRIIKLAQHIPYGAQKTHQLTWQ